MNKKQITAALLMGAVWSGAAAAEPVAVTAFNFARAESDLYFSNVIAKNGGLGVLVHDREPADIDNQVIVRMNRDTLYSSGVYDLEAGPVTVQMPGNEDGRFQSLQVISQDHFTPFVIYEGTLELTPQNVGTRYVMLAFRTFVDPTRPQDVSATHAAQDAIQVTQAAKGSFEIPQWDSATQDQARRALAQLQALGGTVDKVRMGTADAVDPIAHLMATATGWGLNPPEAAIYQTVYPAQNDGQTVHELVLSDVPVDGFWSVSVYNQDGFFEKNALGTYSLNSVTATPDDSGAATIRFGGCEAETVNCLPTPEGWNYSLRLYRPQESLQNGSWQIPAPQPVSD